MKNALPSKFKQSQLEVQINRVVILVLGIQIGLCFILTALAVLWKDSRMEEYLGVEVSNGTLIYQSFFRYFLLLNTLIPISLIVTIEAVKVG